MNDLIDIELEKIEFNNKNTSDPNFPENYEPINSDNLNQMQNNTEDSFNDVNSNFAFLTETIKNQLLKKLWENPTPNTDFNSQTITLESDDYDYLIWVYGFYKGNLWQNSTFSIKTQSKINLTTARDYNVGATYYLANLWRNIEKISDTEYNISSCNVRYNNTDYTANITSYIIPICVLGGKLGGVSNE